MFVIFLEDGLCLTVMNKVLIVCLPLEVICNYGSIEIRRTSYENATPTGSNG